MAPSDADRRLRILLVVHHELVEGSGAAGTTLALAEALEQRGHRVEVVGFGLLASRRGAMLDAVRFPHAVARIVHERLVRGDVDVIDASSGDLAYVRHARVRASRCAVLTRSHGLEPLAIARRRQGARDGELRLRWRYWLYHGGARRLEVTRSLRVADRVLVLNDAEARYVESSLHLPASRVARTTPLVVPLQRAAPTQPVRDVLVLGPASWRKGGDVVVRVLESLLRGDPALTASWHGLDDPEATRRELGDDVGDRVSCVGRYARDELAGLLSAHRVLLSASRSEGLPVTLLEALSVGVPVVAVDVPGVADLLGSGAGVLVPDGHVEGLVGALRQMLGDEAARASASAVAIEVARSRAPAVVVGDLLGTYAETIDLKAPSR
jgi:glycosyltransferase involved in cell wall biosynthesis